MTPAHPAPDTGAAPRRPGRVALVRGPIVSSTWALNNEAVPCLGLAYVAAYARRHGHDVTIVDAVAEGLNRYWPLAEFPGFIAQGLTFAEVVERLPADTDVVGFSAMFSGQWPMLRRLIEAVRARFPRAVLAAGGEHVTALPGWSLRDCPALDACVLGEGEHVFSELLESLGAGGLRAGPRRRRPRPRRADRGESPPAPHQGRGRDSLALLARGLPGAVLGGGEVLRDRHRARHAARGLARLPLPVHVLLQPGDVDDDLPAP